MNNFGVEWTVLVIYNCNSSSRFFLQPHPLLMLLVLVRIPLYFWQVKPQSYSNFISTQSCSIHIDTKTLEKSFFVHVSYHCFGAKVWSNMQKYTSVLSVSCSNQSNSRFTVAWLLYSVIEIQGIWQWNIAWMMLWSVRNFNIYTVWFPWPVYAGLATLDTLCPSLVLWPYVTDIDTFRYIVLWDHFPSSFLFFSSTLPFHAFPSFSFPCIFKLLIVNLYFFVYLSLGRG